MFFTAPVRISLFLLSASTLVFELNLSRLFAVVQFYHFAFMIVSLALLGFGASGTFLAVFPGFGRQNPVRTLGRLALGAGGSMLAGYLLTNWLPFDSFSIAWDWRQAVILALHYVALAVPFFFSGAAVGLLLSIHPEQAGKVYAVNLSGAAAGCLGALAAPPLVGGEGTVLVGSCLAVLAGLIVIPGQLRWVHANIRDKVVLIVSILILGIDFWGLGYQIVRDKPLALFALNLSPYKGLSYALQVPDARLISQEWNAFSRLDLVRSEAIRSLPGVSLRYTSPPPPEDGLLVDGDNLNPVVRPGAGLEFCAYLPAAVAFELRPAAAALILEPGGGLDLLTAVCMGAQKVTAVEPNKLAVDAAVHIYDRREIEPFIGTARSYLRREGAQFDIIQFSLTESYHPVRSGAYSLGEDYSLTLEAVRDALHRLDADGILVLTRWLQLPPSEWLRAFILAAAALEQEDLDPAQQIAAFRSFNTGLILVKRAPFTTGELARIRAFAQDKAFDLVYLPDIQPEETNRFSVLQEPVYYQAFSEYLAAGSKPAWLANYPYEVSPPTDDRPFFGHYFKWSQAPQVLAELGKSWQPFGGAGYFVLLVLLGLAVLMALVIVVLPLTAVGKNKSGDRNSAPILMYFGSIGLAFLLVEIPLIQQFILFLGHPAYALTTALFAILLFSSLGSQFAGRLPLRGILAVLVTLVLVSPWLLRWVFALALGWSLPVRMAVAVGILAPFGALMGVPLPSGIHKLERAAANLIPWAWGVNGALSVIASILAALIALSFGFQWTLLAGAACYAAALGLAGLGRQNQD